jgi:hypothetical protein
MPALRRGRTPNTSPPDRPRSRSGKTDPRLPRAYLLKEGLRPTFRLDYPEVADALEAWIGWARRCRTPTFVDCNAGSSNKICLITRVAFGFKSPDALIALAMLNLGGHRPTLPGRRCLTDRSGEPSFRGHHDLASPSDRGVAGR